MEVADSHKERHGNGLKDFNYSVGTLIPVHKRTLHVVVKKFLYVYSYDAIVQFVNWDNLVANMRR